MNAICYGPDSLKWVGTEHEKHKLPPGDEVMFGYLHAELSHFLLQSLHDLIVIRGKKHRKIKKKRVLRGKGGNKERDGETRVAVIGDFN